MTTVTNNDTIVLSKPCWVSSVGLSGRKILLSCTNSNLFFFLQSQDDKLAVYSLPELGGLKNNNHNNNPKNGMKNILKIENFENVFLQIFIIIDVGSRVRLMATDGNQLLPLYIAESHPDEGVKISMWDTITLSGSFVTTHISVAGVGSKMIALESKVYNLLYGNPYVFYAAANGTRVIFSMQQYNAACGSVSYSQPGQALLYWTYGSGSLKSQVVFNGSLPQDHSLILNNSNQVTDFSIWKPYVCTACEAYDPTEDYSCSNAGTCFNFTFSLDVFPQCACFFGYDGSRCEGRTTEFFWIVYAAPISGFAILILWWIIHVIVTRRSKRIESSTKRGERTIELEKYVLYRERRSVAARRANYGVEADAPLFGVACSGGKFFDFEKFENEMLRILKFEI